MSGAGVGDHRWNDEYKRLLLTSRTSSTNTLVRALLDLDEAPSVLVNGSAIGAYADRGDQVLTETSEFGADFLSHVVQEWEAATGPAAAAGIRAVG